MRQPGVGTLNPLHIGLPYKDPASDCLINNMQKINEWIINKISTIFLLFPCIYHKFLAIILLCTYR